MDSPNTKATAQMDSILKKSKITPFHKFLIKSEDQELNKCLLEKCGGDQGKQCLQEINLTYQILECLSQENFLGKWGMERTEIDKHRCQMRCEIRNKIKPSDELYFINKNKRSLKLIDEFLNPYNNAHLKFNKVNQCIISDKKIWDYYMQIKQNERVFEQSSFDDLIRKTLNGCFSKQFGDDYEGRDKIVTQCAYYCQVFDPEIKNKVKYYGKGIIDGKFKNYTQNILLFD